MDNLGSAAEAIATASTEQALLKFNNFAILPELTFRLQRLESTSVTLPLEPLAVTE
jgi:hypothetical protein